MNRSKPKGRGSIKETIMIIEYDYEDRCIRMDGEFITLDEASGLLGALEIAIDQWEADHTTCEIPDGHNDEF